MKYRGYRVDVVGAVALLTVALLLTGRLAYTRYLVEKPLVRELKALPGVQGVELGQEHGRYVIRLELTQAANLAEVYRKAEQTSGESLGQGRFELKIIDKRSPELEDLYYRLHYYVEEALVRGNFSEAAARIESVAQAAGVKEKLYVDRGHVYIELSQGQHFLYEVRERPVATAGGEPA
ncbi:MAG TPA: hypothetical protein GX511_01795 [Firmicutes bacterium]|nr:hypothetical protein [Bacillota bacterium]